MHDKTVIVTGGGAGIGRAAVLLCADRGARIAVLDLDVKVAAGVAQEALARGARAAVGIGCDVSIESEVEKAVTESCHQLGPLDGVFANAGSDHGLPTRVVLDEIGDIVDNTSNSNETTAVLCLVDKVIPFHHW